MTEPSRNKPKGRLSPLLRLVDTAAEEGLDPLRWWTSHPKKPGEVDLNIFASGISTEEAHAKGMKSGFTGRPQLIRELAPYIRLCSATWTRASVKNLNPALRCWWRLFDACDAIAPVNSVGDLSEIHNVEFIRTERSNRSSYSKMHQFVSVARADLGLPPLFWTAPERSTTTKSIVDQRTVALLYHSLKRKVFDTLRRFEDNPDVAPTGTEVRNVLMIFLIRTGWNLQTALDIDISPNREGNPSCLSNHPTSASHHLVTSRKARAGGREQFALGMNKSQLSCGNLLMALTRQSTSLRAEIRQKHSTLTHSLKSHPPGEACNELIASIKDLEEMLVSPWLFEVQFLQPGDTKGRVRNVSPLNVGAWLKPILNSVRATLPPGSKPLAKVSISDFRDAYIEAQYQQGGYSWLTAMLAAQHGNIKSIGTYLRKRQYKAHSEIRFLSVTERIWESAIQRKAIDPVQIAGQVAGATAEQLSRWAAGRDRTRLGMGCRDFNSPPRTMAPAHVAGSGCRVQRCTLCEHGIVFTDSVSHLARRVAELQHIRASMPVANWEKSTFPTELTTTEEMLAVYFPNAVVANSLNHWRLKIANGAHLPFDLEGAYE